MILQFFLFTAATAAALAAAWTIWIVVGNTGAACMAAVPIGSGIAELLLSGSTRKDVNLLSRKKLLRRVKTWTDRKGEAAVRAGPLFWYGKGETVKCRNEKSWG